MLPEAAAVRHPAPARLLDQLNLVHTLLPAVVLDTMGHLREADPRRQALSKALSQDLGQPRRGLVLHLVHLPAQPLSNSRQLDLLSQR